MIYKLFAIILNEISLLIKDKMGILILFILPVCLVLVMSLIQKNVNVQNKQLNIVLINSVNSPFEKAVEQAFINNDQFSVKLADVKQLQHMKNEVAKGYYQALFVLGKTVRIYLDSSLPSNIANSLTLACNYTIQKVILYGHGIALPNISTNYLDSTGITARPNTAQQNVPAWALFGMFLIVVPLASQMLRERLDSISLRLQLTPTPAILFIIGRNIAYILLNVIQLTLILLVGIYILPKMGISALKVQNTVLLIYAVGFCAALATTGFGLLMGAFCKSQQQISAIGPFIVVILAAVSGIFVPVYLMPKALTIISEFSPMYWAQQAFLDIFVRNSSFLHLLPYLSKLILFYLVMLVLSVYKLRNHYYLG